MKKYFIVFKSVITKDNFAYLLKYLYKLEMRN